MERVRGWAAGAVLALVAWQAGASVLDVGAELFQQPLARHLRPLRATPDELIELALEQDFELWRALRAHVPSGATVLVSFPAQLGYGALMRRLTRLVTLSYPLHFKGWPFDARKPGNGAPWAGALEVYVLELESGRDYAGWARHAELARGAGFRLLVLESEAR